MIERALIGCFRPNVAVATDLYLFCMHLLDRPMLTSMAGRSCIHSNLEAMSDWYLSLVVRNSTSNLQKSLASGLDCPSADVEVYAGFQLPCGNQTLILYRYGIVGTADHCFINW